MRLPHYMYLPEDNTIDPCSHTHSGIKIATVGHLERKHCKILSSPQCCAFGTSNKFIPTYIHIENNKSTKF